MREQPTATDLGKTKNDQQQEPKPKGESPVLRCNQRRDLDICVSRAGHTGRHKFRPYGRAKRPRSHVGAVALGKSTSAANDEARRIDHETGTPTVRRVFVGLSVQFVGGAVGVLHLPVPFTAADIRCVRRFCDYLDDAFAEDFAADAEYPFGHASSDVERDADWREEGRVAAEQADAALAVYPDSRSTPDAVTPTAPTHPEPRPDDEGRETDR